MKAEEIINEADRTWSAIQRQAEATISEGGLAALMLRRYVLNHSSMAPALAQLLSEQLHTQWCLGSDIQDMLNVAYMQAPQLVGFATRDLNAVLERDPATSEAVNAFLLSKGFHALQIYRTANWYWQVGRCFNAEALSHLCRANLGVDIHPAARIGSGVLFDHADGIVIGATAVIGDDVTLFHGVTLGAEYGANGDRHPKIGDGVVVGANASIIGNVTIGGHSRIGCGAVVLSDVTDGSVCVGVPAKTKKMVTVQKGETKPEKYNDCSYYII